MIAFCVYIEAGVLSSVMGIIPKGQEDHVVELYGSGESIAGIISKTRVKSEQTVYRILQEAGTRKRRNWDKG